jgi:multidrug resistance efflux pump
MPHSHWSLQSLTNRRRVASLSDTSENLRRATLRRELVDLRADQDAVVLTVSKVSVGSVMQSGEPLITLVRHA